MEHAVAEVAVLLGVDESRVRAMLRAGRLRGRVVGRQWLVDGDEVARAVRERAPRGRPLSAAQAWGVLDLLDGGRAPWLDAVGRSRARARARSLVDAPVNRWRAALARRQDRYSCAAHPAALLRLREASDVVPAGPPAAAAAGADLVVIGAPVEVYVPVAAWPDLVRRLAIRVGVAEPDLVVRVPVDVWPFGVGAPSPGLAVLAADLLDSAEPRAISAGVEALVRLGRDLPARSGRHP